MSEINKLIEICDYKFELILRSKSVHAHSLMTDYKSFIDNELDSYTYNALKHILNSKVIIHKKEKKL